MVSFKNQELTLFRQGRPGNKCISQLRMGHSFQNADAFPFFRALQSGMESKKRWSWERNANNAEDKKRKQHGKVRLN